VEVTVDVEVEDIELDEDVEVGVVKLDMIPLPLTGYVNLMCKRNTCNATPVQEGRAGDAEAA
jgi:hypothetical protein